jgi:hypothetical protein
MSTPDLAVGMMVRFHPIIGGKHDGRLYRVSHMDHHRGHDLVWLAGMVATGDPRAISLPVPGIDCFGLSESSH